MTKDELILENVELRSQLLLAQKWMRREVANSIRYVQEENQKKIGRKKINNILQEEHLGIITRRIMGIFGDSLKNAPKYTLERLIDAEIYWSTLQQYPGMDALPIVIAYQKILDAWIEDALISPWRISNKWKSRNEEQRKYDVGVDKDLQAILLKDYTLSVWRLYQIVELIRNNTLKSPLLLDLIAFWKRDSINCIDNLISDTFFLPFQELMNREIFTKKRHEAKVSYADAKLVREIFLEKRNLLFLFETRE
jgi:hypothetical protein